MTADRGKKNPEMTDLLKRYTNLSLILVDRRIDPIDLLYGFVKHHRTMETAVEACFAGGGCYRRRLRKNGGLEKL